MPIDAAGFLSTAQFIASPNCDERPPNTEICLLVIHNISLPPDEFGGDGVIELFTNRIDPQAHPYYQSLQGLKVSAHFFIRRDGAVIQFVPCSQRAWHAGVSNWQGRERCNDFSIGIELEGADEMPYAAVQYEVLARLVAALRQAMPSLRRAPVVGHSDIAPGRKTDPGSAFDWGRLAGLLERAGRG